MFKKHLHYSQELETAIIGACLLEKSAFSRIYDQVEAAHFYFDSHKEVFSCLREMYESGAPIDIYTVNDFLQRKRGIELLANIDTLFFLMQLTNHVVSTAHLEYHSFVIRQMFVERELMRITMSGPDSDSDARTNISALQRKLQELNQGSVKSDWKDITELMVEMYRHQDELEKKGGKGIATGFKKLDQDSGGFHPGQVIVVGARPSVGKSALAGQMAIEMAKTGLKVGIISLEMNNNEIAARLASIDTDTDFSVLYRGLYFDQNQRERVYNRIASHTSKLNIFVSDKTDVNINEIRAKATKLKHQEGLDVLMIDYLQLVDSEESKFSNRENEIRKISRGSKVMAKEMNIPVIELCQLNREVTKRKGQDRYPQLSDLRESGSIEQDADIVMFLHRDYMAGILTDESGASTEKQADLIVRKWRNGNSNFNLPLDFDPPKMKFTERRISGFQPIATNFYEKEKDQEPF